MTTPHTLRRKLKFKGSRQPTAQKLKGRKTTITNAFVLSVLPVIDPSDEDIFAALAVLEQDPDDVRCAYCGAPSHGWDHLRPVVRQGQPTGYITEIANLVPACGKCNSSKGGQDWRAWMLSTSAPGSPTRKGVSDVAQRVALLERFEQWRKPTRIDFASLVGKDEWNAYWSSRDAMIAEMMRCQTVADRILATVIQQMQQPST